MANTDSIKILIVDDNPNNLLTLHGLIDEYIEVQILEANSGQAALNLLMKQSVDLIILDVQMPEMDGFETATLIRSYRKTKHVPIVFLTAAYKSEEFQQQGFAIGAADYLTKPIDTPQLISRLKTYIRFIEQDRLHNIELERKVQERTAQLLEAHNELEWRVKERTAELAIAKQEAEQAQAIAETANRAKNQFLANMSHELRTPLNGILGYTQMLNRESSLNTKHQEAIAVIQRSGEYLLTLISDILDMSKIETNRIELYPSEFNFGHFLQNIIEPFQMRAKQQGIAFVYEKLSPLPKGVRADEKRLRQIFIHLLSNALKFTNKGCVCVRIDYQNPTLQLLVEDTGVGIAKENFDKIFQPFQQLCDKHLHSEGAGLGLSITKKLVEMMGGELHVSSTLGKGSTFWAALDLPEAPNEMKSGMGDDLNLMGFQGNKRQILVADDKEANRQVLVNLLAPLGFLIIEAVDGEEAVNKACEYQPDLIMMDLVMPTMDGFEATRKIRRIPELKEVIIIMTSTSVFECHSQQSPDAYCDDFIAKPISPEELLKLLEKYLDLTWIYNTEPIITENVHEQILEKKPEDVPLVTPSTEQMAILFDLAMRGDLSNIVGRLNEFEQLNHRLAPFANQIRALAKNFEEEKIFELIERYK